MLNILKKAKRRGDALLNDGLGIPPPQSAWGADKNRAIVGELISDTFGAVWTAVWRRGK